ncbi:MAG: hypothetical protein QOK37_1755 [Thermoanaerobaculia bacterium]|jgi:hypothetical protein|nr:hypothetical protein [Thermoanaerobaculia bacterium]
MKARRWLLVVGAAVHLGYAAAAVGANIVIVNKDPAGVGFNDSTPAAPVGGNGGTTLGQQRLNVFQAAAAIWGAKLSSTITIKVAANFGSLTPCTVSQGVLGSAGPTQFIQNFPGAPRPNTYYPVALGSALSAVDYAVTLNLTDGASIRAQFNSNIGTAGCLPNLSWYLGLDTNFNHANQIDLETVLLHEFAHGLGFVGLVNLNDGSLPNNTPDIYSHFTFDDTTLLHWDVMSNAQRLASSTNAGNVVFDGPNVTGASGLLTSGRDALGHPRLYTPATLAPGSSVFHFDTTASPNQLMEPSLNLDLTHNVDVPNDLTMKEMLDIGWPPAVAAGPANDSCSTAIVASGASFTDSQTASAATATGSDPIACAGNGGASVWYRYTAPSSGIVTVDTIGSNYNTVLSSWTGSCGAFVAVPNGCDDNSGGNSTSSGTFTANAGVTYYFMVTSFSGSGGTLTFHLNSVPISASSRRNDFNGDGKSDILWRNASTGSNYMYLMNGLTLVTPGQINVVNDVNWKIAGTGDFDGDGKADVLWRNSATGSNYMYLMNGPSLANAGQINIVADQNWSIVGAGDFDGDGKSDILWRNSVTGSNYVYLMNGISIKAVGEINVIADQTWKVAGVGDFDGDGKADILWRNSASGSNYIYLMNGIALKNSGQVNVIADLNWKVVGTGDFDGDGKADILWRNSVTGDDYLYEMNGFAIKAPGAVNTVNDQNWAIVSTGDYNGDGRADILWRNASTGSDYMYLMNGFTIVTPGQVNVVNDPNWKIVY